MKIVLINAAAPDYSWKKRYSPSAFTRECAAYAATRLKEGAVSQAKLTGYHLWHASSLHARQTAEMMIGTNTEISVEETALLDEIPLVPFTEKDRELPLWKYEWPAIWAVPSAAIRPNGPGSCAISKCF